MLYNLAFCVWFKCIYANYLGTKCFAFRNDSEKHLHLLIHLYEQLSRQKGEWNSLL